MKPLYTALTTVATPVNGSLRSNPGEGLDDLSSAVTGRGVIWNEGGSFPQVEQSTYTNQGGTHMENTRMSYTIEEAFTGVYGMSWIDYETCPVCLTEVLSIVDNDPGSVEAAVGVHHVCDHPKCLEIAGTNTIICGEDIEELLRKDNYDLAVMGDIVVDCNGFKVNIGDILDRRYEVEFEKDMEEDEQDFYEEDHSWMMHEDEQEVDLETEKWNNYWSDYNQCGIRVSY